MCAWFLSKVMPFGRYFHFSVYCCLLLLFSKESEIKPVITGLIFFLLFHFDDKRIDPSEKICVRFCFLIKECNLKVNIAA